MFYIILCICKTVILYVPRYVVRVNKIQFNSMQVVSTKLFYSRVATQGNSFKLHFSETQDDRECQRVNCKFVGDYFKFDE